jgi:hypothetical protein
MYIFVLPNDTKHPDSKDLQNERQVGHGYELVRVRRGDQPLVERNVGIDHALPKSSNETSWQAYMILDKDVNGAVKHIQYIARLNLAHAAICASPVSPLRVLVHDLLHHDRQKDLAKPFEP